MMDGMGCMWPVWLIVRARMSMADVDVNKEKLNEYANQKQNICVCEEWFCIPSRHTEVCA